MQNQQINPGSKYVSLGSSFGAGPGVGKRSAGSYSHCLQSDSNYAHLLALKRGLVLFDKTCSGATTADILSEHQYGLPPQIEAVDAETKLVTLTVGGNDIHYLSGLWSDSYANAPDKVPEAWTSYVSESVNDDVIEAAIGELPHQMKNIIASVRQRAPQAIIILVNYMAVLPENKTCVTRAPLSSQGHRKAINLASKLVEITSSVAQENDVLLLDANKISKGHDVCSEDPWIFPFVFPEYFETFGPIAYHPNLKGMQAIADALDNLLVQYFGAEN